MSDITSGGVGSLGSTEGTPLRRIVQIATLQESINHGAALYALADDGTVWIARDNQQLPWKLVPGIPQPPHKKPADAPSLSVDPSPSPEHAT